MTVFIRAINFKNRENGQVFDRNAFSKKRTICAQINFLQSDHEKNCCAQDEPSILFIILKGTFLWRITNVVT